MDSPSQQQHSRPNQSCCQHKSLARKCETSGGVGTKDFILNEVGRITYYILQIEKENQILFHSCIKHDGHYSTKLLKAQE